MRNAEGLIEQKLTVTNEKITSFLCFDSHANLLYMIEELHEFHE